MENSLYKPCEEVDQSALFEYKQDIKNHVPNTGYKIFGKYWRPNKYNNFEYELEGPFWIDPKSYYAYEQLDRTRCGNYYDVVHFIIKPVYTDLDKVRQDIVKLNISQVYNEQGFFGVYAYFRIAVKYKIDIYTFKTLLNLEVDNPSKLSW